MEYKFNKFLAWAAIIAAAISIVLTAFHAAHTESRIENINIKIESQSENGK